MYKKDLEKEIESETSNDFEKLLKALLHVNIYVIDHHLWLNYNLYNFSLYITFTGNSDSTYLKLSPAFEIIVPLVFFFHSL